MPYETLRRSLLSDLSAIGCPCTFDLCIKDYSKTFYGCYRTKTNRVFLYYYEDPAKTIPYSYDHLLDKAIHEAVHAQQWSDPDFVRVRGVMHDEEFYALYSIYTERAKKLRNNEKVCTDNAKAVERSTVIPISDFQGRVVRANTGFATRPAGRVLRVACRRRV